MAKSIVKNIVVALRAQLGGFGGAMKGATAAVGGLVNAAKSGTAAIAGGLSAGMAGLAVAAAVAAKEAISFVESETAAIASCTKLADRLNISTRALGGLEYAAQKAEMSTEDFTGGLATFSKNMGDTINGVGRAQKTFDELGLSAEKLAAMSMDQAFLKVADAISKLPTAAQRAAAANKLFGDASGRMAAMMAGGSSAILDQMRAADAMGLTYSSATSKMALSTMKAFGRIKDILTGLGRQFVTAVLPWVEKMANGILAAAKYAMGFLQYVFEVGFSHVGEILATFYTIGETVFDAIADVLGAFGVTLSGTGGLVQTVLSAVMGIFRWLAEGLIKVITFVEAVFVNWKAALTVVFYGAMLGAVTFYETIKYFFTVSLPAYLSWFGEHWREVFDTMWNFVKTFAVNVGTNIYNLFVSIKDFFQGKGWNFQWTGLLDGFENTMKQLPVIAERQKTGLEISLAKTVSDAVDNIGGYYDKKVTERLGKLDARRQEANKIADAVEESKKPVTERIALAAANAAAGGPDTGRQSDFGVLGSRMSLSGLAAGGANDKQTAIAQNTESSADSLRALNRKAAEGALVFVDDNN